MRHQGISERLGVYAGLCRAWPLPPNETCAAEARRIFRRAVDGLALAPGVFDDALLMASELAANTLHASEAARAMDPRAMDPRAMDTMDGDAPASAELWLYLRGVGMARELVCKVFDCYRGWLNGPPPDEFTDLPDSGERGRGLRIVSELSGGRWGHHLTRARLATWGMCGKAVWFAVPAPMAHPRLADVTGLRDYTRSVDVTAGRLLARMTPPQAARELTQLLAERGLGKAAFSRTDEPAGDETVLTFRQGITLWCRKGTVTISAPGGHLERWGYNDVIEVVEQTIRSYEELACERSLELVIA